MMADRPCRSVGLSVGQIFLSGHFGQIQFKVKWSLSDCFLIGLTTNTEDDTVIITIHSFSYYFFWRLLFIRLVGPSVCPLFMAHYNHNNKMSKGNGWLGAPNDGETDFASKFQLLRIFMVSIWTLLFGNYYRHTLLYRIFFYFQFGTNVWIWTWWMRRLALLENLTFKHLNFMS